MGRLADMANRISEAFPPQQQWDDSREYGLLLTDECYKMENELAAYRTIGTVEQCEKWATLLSIENSTIYAVEGTEIAEVFIHCVSKSYAFNEGWEIDGIYEDDSEDWTGRPSDIGKTVFLTREDAENALLEGKE